MARSSVPGAIPLNVAFEGHFHLINIQYHVYKNAAEEWRKLVKEAQVDERGRFICVVSCAIFIALSKLLSGVLQLCLQMFFR